MNAQNTADAILELHRDAGTFKGLTGDALRLRAYDVTFPELLTSVGLRDAGKYTDIALESVMGLPRIFGGK